MLESKSDTAVVASASVFSGYPVFRGFSAMGAGPGDIARIVGQSSVTVENWASGRDPIPDEWAAYLTRLLAGWVRALEQGSGEDGRMSLAAGRNWLDLAQEAVKDLPPQALVAAEKLADARLGKAA